MYSDRFGLRAAPFSISPDPAFTVATASHTLALGRLLRLGQGEPGWIKVTGAAGVGKTLLCRRLRDLLPAFAAEAAEHGTPGRVADILHLPHPSSTPIALLRALLVALEPNLPLSPHASEDDLAEALRRALAQRAVAGSSVVACLDECQAMAPPALDALRRVAEPFVDPGGLQIVLFGNPELDGILTRPDMAPLRSRIACQLVLAPMASEETAAYLRRRLELAGAPDPELFPPRVADLVHRAARGIPRAVNLIAHNALTNAAGARAPKVAPAHVHAAAAATPDANRLGALLRAASWFGALVGSS